MKKGCVNGHNIILYSDYTTEKCAKKCDENYQCKGFEFGVDYKGQNGNYHANDCQLQSSSNYNNCDGTSYNLDLYLKRILFFGFFSL